MTADIYLLEKLCFFLNTLILDIHSYFSSSLVISIGVLNISIFTTFMLSHVNEGERGLCSGHCPFDDRIWTSDESKDSSIRRLASINVQKFDPGNASDGIRNGIDYLEK
jgi:hypothetical protein